MGILNYYRETTLSKRLVSIVMMMFVGKVKLTIVFSSLVLIGLNLNFVLRSTTSTIMMCIVTSQYHYHIHIL